MPPSLPDSLMNTAILTDTKTHRRQRRHFSRLLAPVFALLVTLPTQLSAATVAADRAAVIAVVDALFTAMRNKDEVALRALFLPEARLGTSGVDGWIANVTTSTAKLDEQTFDETVMIDGDMAIAWTPYTLSVDGSFHHCGVDAFILRRVERAWRILQIDDTRRTEGCDNAP